MDVVIRNLSSRMLYVRLHNGQNVRLAPGASSSSMHQVQVKGNATVEKLVKQRMIAIIEPKVENPKPPKAEDAEPSNTAGKVADAAADSPGKPPEHAG